MQIQQQRGSRQSRSRYRSCWRSPTDRCHFGIRHLAQTRIHLRWPLPPSSRAHRAWWGGVGGGGLSADSPAAAPAETPPTLDPSPPLRGGREKKITPPSPVPAAANLNSP